MTKILAVSAVLLFLLTASSALSAAPTEIRIGATVSETGKFATEVGPFSRLFTAWAELINAKGGLRLKKYGASVPVKTIVYDDQSQEAATRRLYERLAVKDRVDFMFGPYSSPLTFSASVAAENRDIPFLAICANSPKIYSRGFQWLACVIDEAPRYTYRYWEMVKARGSDATVGFVVEDTLHPLGVYQGARVLAREAGLTEVSAHILAPDTQDFTPVLAALEKAKPDIIFVSANIPFSIAFMKQALEYGLSPKEWHVIHHSGVFRDTLGAMADSIVGQIYWTPRAGDDMSRFWVQILERANVDTAMYPWAPAYLAAFQVAQQAIENAGSLDKAEIMKSLKALRTRTPLGEAWFKENGSGAVNTYPAQIQGGNYVIVWPPEMADGKPVYPAPVPK